MILYGKKKISNVAARVDPDVIAFLVEEEEVDVITDFLVAAIVNNSLMEFGEMPEILE